MRLFFVLSGFLITGILLRCRQALERKHQTLGMVIRQFYIRRSLRIFPIYYLTLAIAFTAGFSPIRDHIGWHLTYTSNFLFIKEKLFPYCGHLWSLAVEEQFYLCWPWLILLVPRRFLVGGLLAVIAVGPIFRLFCLVNYGLGTEARAILTPACLDALGLGALLAVYSGQPAEKRSPRHQFILRHGGWIWIALFGLYHLGAQLGATAYVKGSLGDLMYVLLFTWIIARTADGVTGPVGWMLNRRSVIYIGRISYGLYLYHNFMPLLVPRFLNIVNLTYPTDPAGQFFVLAGSSFVTAVVSWHVFEKPINNLKRFFEYDPQSASAISPKSSQVTTR